MNPYYKDYAEYLDDVFNTSYPGLLMSGDKVQKISVNAGFSCPNRDGTIGKGGCLYCNNASFSPQYCMKERDSVGQQVRKGMEFFGRKYQKMKYLAYFQSFTNTHSKDCGHLSAIYNEALACDGVVGLVVGTRPDTFSDEVAALLGKLAERVPVFVEFGAESSHDTTLAFINRGHKWCDTVSAVERSTRHGLHTGLHLIAGLPGEREEDIMVTVERCCALPIESLKLHQLQVIVNTPLSDMWRRGEIELRYKTKEQYLGLCSKIVERVPQHICIERFLASAPPEMVIAPRWGIKNYEFTHLLHNELKKKKQKL